MSNNETATASSRRKRRRVFPWIYLLMQFAFLIWIITAAQASHCDAQGSQTANSACTAGTGIGIALVIGLWAAADVIVGGTYVVYRLSSRNRGS